MVAFLTPAWIDALDRAVRDVALGAGAGAEGEVAEDAGAGTEPLTIQQVVTDGDAPPVTFHLVVGDGTARVLPGMSRTATVTFIQDRCTAAAIAAGRESAQVAFTTGRLRLGGDIAALLERSRQLAVLDDVFAAVREATAFGDDVARDHDDAGGPSGGAGAGHHVVQR